MEQSIVFSSALRGMYWSATVEVLLEMSASDARTENIPPQ